MFERVVLKFDGQCHEWSVSELDMPIEHATDVQVLNGVHQKLASMGISADNLSGYVVDPPESERLSDMHEGKIVLNIRPHATWARRAKR